MHERIEFPMPASAAAVFDAFHYQRWRIHWDSLVARTAIAEGAPCPSVGAVTVNAGAGWLAPLSMRTQFVSYDPGRVAAAVMIGRAFPFRAWAASMRHRAIDGHSSVMVYTYRFEAVIAETIVHRAFSAQTRKRFARLQRFLQEEGDKVLAWQEQGRPA